MKQFEVPELEIHIFGIQDIVTTSGTGFEVEDDVLIKT